MDQLINIQKKLVPDLMDTMTGRHRILQSVHFLQPIGRRALAINLGMTERVLRGEVTYLGEQGLLLMSSNGMRLSNEGERLLTELEATMRDVSGLTLLEKQLADVLGVAKTVVVPGDSDKHKWVQNELGLACIKEMEASVTDGGIIGVTGGTTLAAVAQMMRPFKGKQHPLFVSARGGLGERVENQANTICARMAESADGQYRLLHVPDQISESTYATLIEEPSIKEVLQLIQDASLIVHGIGEAKTMAKRRRTDNDLLQKIDEEQAVAEAFGYFFDENGKVVHKVKTIGLQLENLYENRTVFAIAGGRSKAKAIEAYFKQGPKSILVTDEGAARGILSKN